MNKLFSTLMLLSFFQVFSYAGGPILVNNGDPIIWNNSIARYGIETGRFGPLTNREAQELVRRAFQKWEDVETSSLIFEEVESAIEDDVTRSNFESIVDDLFNAPLNSRVHPIIFDNDGRIINSFFGIGARENFLGFAGPTLFNSGNNVILQARAIFNGYLFDEANIPREDMFNTVLHELGHFAGLGHAQFNRHLAFNGVGSDDAKLPVMFPTTSEDDSFRNELTHDDINALSNIYPSDEPLNDFLSTTGRIRGSVKRGRRDLRGVNVVAINKEEPFTKMYSTVTGTFNQSNAEYNFRIPTGDYFIKIEAIDTDFTGPSSVGFFADDLDDPSFDDPPKQEFYNDNDDDDEGRSLADIVTVTRFSTVRNIDFDVDDDELDLSGDEVDVTILGIGGKEWGGVGRFNESSFPFLINPSGDEDRLDLDIALEQTRDIEVQIEMETGRNDFERFTFEVNEPERRIIISDDGDIPLDDTRYFVTVQNNTSSEVAFTLALSKNDEPVPTPTETPTFTPTHTPTPTSTFTPTPTFTPTNTPTQTPTQTPTPTPTETPIPLPIADVNGDGNVDANDVFYYIRLWKNSAEDHPNADFFQDASGRINAKDLLIFIEAYKNRNR